jgi:integrase
VFLRRVWNPTVGGDLKRGRARLFAPGRRVTPHTLRHTWASLHLTRGTPLKWIQAQGGWTSAKLLLDTYGHLLSETSGYADRLADGPRRTQGERSSAAEPTRRASV